MSSRRFQIKHALLIVLAVLALAVTAAAIAMPKAQAPVSERVAMYTPEPLPETRVVGVIGDSYTGGSLMGGIEDKNWTAVLARELNLEGERVAFNPIGLGGSGYVSRGPNGKTFGDVVPQGAHSKTDVVVIFGSINDERQPIGEVTKASDNVLKDIRKALPKAPIVIIGPAWMNADVPAEVFAVRDALKANAAASKVTFVDPLAEKWFFDRPSFIGTDGVHPTDEGHTYMSEKIKPHLTKALGALGE